MSPNDQVWFPGKDGSLNRGTVVSIHGPITRLTTWDGKRNVYVEAYSNQLLPYVEGEPPPCSLDQQIAAVKRELAMREAVYPKRVEGKLMMQEKADYQIAVMSAVLKTLEGLK